MTKVKWQEIRRAALSAVNAQLRVFGPPVPENWFKEKALLVNFIKEMDAATEVYEMETKVK